MKLLIKGLSQFATHLFFLPCLLKPNANVWLIYQQIESKCEKGDEILPSFHYHPVA